MPNTLTIVIRNNDEQYIISLEDGKVMSGSLFNLATDEMTDLTRNNYELCGYPYVELSPSNITVKANI